MGWPNRTPHVSGANNAPANERCIGPPEGRRHRHVRPQIGTDLPISSRGIAYTKLIGKFYMPTQN
jgi:hypothetical protein